MENISEFQEDLRDLEFGNGELQIVQESYSALEKSYDILYHTKNPSHQAVQLHRIHVQSLADRLGVQMNTVAVESFSLKTIQVFALEESEGFFVKIGKAIAAIFKWIKDAIVGIFRFIFGMSSGDKAEKAKAVAEKASDSVKNIKIEPEKKLSAKVTITAVNEKGEQVTEIKELHGSLAVLQSFLEKPEEITNTFVTLFNLLEDVLKAQEDFSQKYSEKVRKNITAEEGGKIVDDIHHFAVEKMAFLESKYKFGTASSGHRDFTAFHKGRWDKPIDMSSPHDPDKNKPAEGDEYYAFGFAIEENDKFRQSKSESDKSFTIDKASFTKVKDALEDVQDKITDFSKREKGIRSKLDEISRGDEYGAHNVKALHEKFGYYKVEHAINKLKNRFALDTKNLVWHIGSYAHTISKLQRSFYDLSQKVVKLSENHTQAEFDAVMADKDSALKI